MQFQTQPLIPIESGSPAASSDENAVCLVIGSFEFARLNLDLLKYSALIQSKLSDAADVFNNHLRSLPDCCAEHFMHVDVYPF